MQTATIHVGSMNSQKEDSADEIRRQRGNISTDFPMNDYALILLYFDFREDCWLCLCVCVCGMGLFLFAEFMPEFYRPMRK